MVETIDATKKVIAGTAKGRAGYYSTIDGSFAAVKQASDKATADKSLQGMKHRLQVTAGQARDKYYAKKYGFIK